MLLPLHVQDEEIRPAIAVDVRRGRIAAPAGRFQSDFGRDVFEAAAPEVLVEGGVFEAIGVEVTEERIFEPDVCAIRPFLIVRVAADIADEEIHQAVLVVVEEHSAR